MHETSLGLGSGFLMSPATFDSCAFVDTNPVMKRFSDLHEGRCMEEFDLSDSFTDPLQQSTKTWSWWLYSFNHVASDAGYGDYYLQSWLTTRDDTTVTTQGKYEMTLGPHVWYGYASQATLDLAQSQGTSCSCAVHALDYKEHYPERLGEWSAADSAAFQEAQLEAQTCPADTTQRATTSDGTVLGVGR